MPPSCKTLIDNLIEHTLDPKVYRLFIIDGAKALSKVICRTFAIPPQSGERSSLSSARKELLRQTLTAAARWRGFICGARSALKKSLRDTAGRRSGTSFVETHTGSAQFSPAGVHRRDRHHYCHDQ